jgi:hypothetical protein
MAPLIAAGYSSAEAYNIASTVVLLDREATR